VVNKMLTKARKNLIATFLLNISVAWFVATFITEGE